MSFHRTVVLLSSICILFTFYCANGNLCRRESPRHFFANKFSVDDKGIYQVESVPIGSNKKIELYIAKDLFTSESRIQGRMILDEFSKSTFIDKMHTTFGLPSDVDNNEKTSVLMLDIDDGNRANASSSFVAGYFSPSNIYSNREIATQSNGSSCSNEKDLLYMDIVQADIGSPKFYSTLAHEYQHLLHFNKDIKENPQFFESTWVNEGLSELASDLTLHGPQNSRLNSLFLNDKSYAYLSEDVSFVLWGTASQNQDHVLAYYSYSYLFFRFLHDVYGDDTITKVFANQGSNIAGINTALRNVHEAGGISPLTDCDTAHIKFSYFDCVYRAMWSDLLGYPTTKDGKSFSFESTPMLGDTNSTGSPQKIYSHRLSTTSSTSTTSVSNRAGDRHLNYNNDASNFNTNAASLHSQLTSQEMAKKNFACIHEEFLPDVKQFTLNGILPIQ